MLIIDGRYVDTLAPGLYAFWKDEAESKLAEVDLRESMADVSGQEIMTADKVTLRMNAVVTYRIVDARKAVSGTEDVRQALYRELQLALRAVVGARELDPCVQLLNTRYNIDVRRVPNPAMKRTTGE